MLTFHKVNDTRTHQILDQSLETKAKTPCWRRPLRSHCKIPVKALVSMPGQSLAQSVRAMFPGNKNFTKVSSRQRKSYQRSVLHRAALAAPSLPPPKNGSLRQAAQACVQRLQAVSALPKSLQNSKKRPYPDSPSAPSPSNLSPLAQRIRSDIQVGESEEVESPEKEILRRLLP